MLRRCGVLGDIHEEHDALEHALALFAERGLDRVLAVGDIVDGPGDLDLCVAALQQHGVEAVRGNHDRWAVRGQMRGLPHATETLSPSAERYLLGLPSMRTYDTPSGRLLLCHGLFEDDMNRITPDDFGYALDVNDPLQRLLLEREFRFVINGHSHHRMVRHFEQTTIINAGTLLREHHPCIAVADFEELAVEFFDLVDGRPQPGERLALDS